MIVSRFNLLLNTSNHLCQKFQEFPKEAFRPDEIPSNSRYCFAGHYVAMIVTRIVPDVQSTVDTNHFVINHGQDPFYRSSWAPSEILIKNAVSECLSHICKTCRSTEIDDMKVNMILAFEMS